MGTLVQKYQENLPGTLVQKYQEKLNSGNANSRGDSEPERGGRGSEDKRMEKGQGERAEGPRLQPSQLHLQRLRQ